MTFSCIKFKKKFKMKFSLTNARAASNQSNEKTDDGIGAASSSRNHGDLCVREPPASSSSSSSSASSTSRSSSITSAVAIVNKGRVSNDGGTLGAGAVVTNKSYSTMSSSRAAHHEQQHDNMNASTAGVCRVSSSLNDTVTNSYEMANQMRSLSHPNKSTSVISSSKGKNKKLGNKKFKLKKKPKKLNGKIFNI